MDTCRVCNKQIPIGTLCAECADIDPDAKCAVCGEFLRLGDEFAYKIVGWWKDVEDTPRAEYQPIHLRCSNIHFKAMKWT